MVKLVISADLALSKLIDMVSKPVDSLDLFKRKILLD